MPRQIATWPHYDADESAAVTRVLQSGKVNYWTGEECRQFEAEYARHCQAKYAIALMNGSVALELALEAAEIGPGDDVVVTAKSFIASASSVVRIGARPVFADVDAASQNLTAATIAAALTPASKAVVVVHHGGWPCEMDPIISLAQQHGLTVVEDCAQAHGASYKGRAVGGIGDVGTFSFCQDKIITTGGEGGLLVTNSESLWRRAWSIKDHGKDYDAVFRTEHPPGFRWLHASIGTNFRMTEMQAAIGRLQLQKLPDWNRRRAKNAAAITAVLRRYACMVIPDVPAHMDHANYRLYAFVDEQKLGEEWNRDRLIEALSARGMPVFAGGCSEIYRERAFADAGLGPARRLPVASALADKSLAFLVHPTLTADDLDFVANCLTEVLDAASLPVA